MIGALAGRRIDSLSAEHARFPLRNVKMVRDRIADAFSSMGVQSLVASAACGADLIAHDVALDLGLRRVVVLPSSASIFRQRSVVDRPGPWGELFDRLIADALVHGEVVELGGDDFSHDALRRANEAILDRSIALAGPRALHRVLPIVVWDGKPRGERDLTAGFAMLARTRGLLPYEILTL